MSKTIIYPEPFESKLKKLRIKTRFIKNRKAWKKHPNYHTGQQIDIENDWWDFIASAFAWDNAPEGSIYWSTISNS